MSVLQINTSARFKDSNTRVISQYLVGRLGQPTVTRDLAQHPLPPIRAEDLVGVHGSFTDSRESLQSQLALSDQLIGELNAADTLVVAMPIYNFTVPVVLKQWIDAVCRAGVSFRYTEQGPEGLLDIKRAYIITASGGTPIGTAMDFASPYMEFICRFIGVKDVVHIDASGSKGSPQEIIARAKQDIDALLPFVPANHLSATA